MYIDRHFWMGWAAQRTDCAVWSALKGLAEKIAGRACASNRKVLAPPGRAVDASFPIDEVRHPGDAQLRDLLVRTAKGRVGRWRSTIPMSGETPRSALEVNVQAKPAPRHLQPWNGPQPGTAPWTLRTANRASAVSSGTIATPPSTKSRKASGRRQP
jgi:hypothetical protein